MAPKFSKKRMSALSVRAAEARKQQKDERERLLQDDMDNIGEPRAVPGA
jgi:hypothetical protein